MIVIYCDYMFLFSVLSHYVNRMTNRGISTGMLRYLKLSVLKSAVTKT